jgi:regulator of RNase E activity RraA
VRDIDAFEALGFPCWARGISLRGPYKEGPGSINAPVTVGGMLVNPGDIMVGDSDGLVAVPASLAVETAAKAQEKIRTEQATLAAIRAGTYSSAWVDTILKQKGF